MSIDEPVTQHRQGASQKLFAVDQQVALGIGQYTSLRLPFL
jgi:hypothetical protein